MSKKLKLIFITVVAAVLIFVALWGTCTVSMNLFILGKDNLTREIVSTEVLADGFGHRFTDFQYAAVDYIYSNSEMTAHYGEGFVAEEAYEYDFKWNTYLYDLTNGGTATMAVAVQGDTWLVGMRKFPFCRWSIQDVSLMKSSE